MSSRATLLREFRHFLSCSTLSCTESMHVYTDIMFEPFYHMLSLANIWNGMNRCYNNCPGSAESGPEKQKQQVYCNAAKALPSSSTTIASSTASATEAKKTSSSTATSTSTSTGAAALPTAAFGTVEGGLMLGVVLGVLGL